MIFARVIPILLLKGEGLVKTVQFKNPKYIGDPINAVRIFNEKEVDELIILDITASIDNREPNYKWIKNIVSECFMPVAYGGGIKTIEQIKKIFDLGIEKVVINTNLSNLDLIRTASKIYGCQSILGAIDVKKSFFGDYQIYTHSGTKKMDTPILEFLTKIIDAGIGEIVIQSINHEGKMNGYDISLIKSIISKVKIPVIASGGAGSLNDIREAIMSGGASAAAAGSLFIYKGIHKAVLINYPEYKILKSLYND